MSREDTQFKPGVSGNPRGAPKKKKSITHLVEKYLKKRVGEVGSRKSYKQLFVEKAIALALEGDLTAIKLIWNYSDGMPVQKHEVAGSLENPLLTKLEEYNAKDNINTDNNE